MANSFFDFTMTGIDGKEVPLETYKGKYALVVNVASQCGYTPQYEDLQNLHKAHGDKIAVLGFPANNFGGQEPGSNEQIAQFCDARYGVEFPMFAKIDVVGGNRHELYGWLARETGQEPNWNFCKYLIDPEGKAVAFFKSGTNPMDAAIVDQL